MGAAKEIPVGLPPLSPVQVELMEVMSENDASERSVALAMNFDAGELRAQVRKLSAKLSLPAQETPSGEFAQLAREAVRLAAAQSKAVEHIRSKLKLNGVNNKTIAAWQEELVSVASAVARGVLITVDPYKIRPMHGQPREYFPDEEQSSLEDSFGLMGQVQDIIVRKKDPPKSNLGAVQEVDGSGKRMWRMANTEYEICDGERRWRGAISKGLAEVRAKLIDIDDRGAYLVAGVSNFNRVGHTTLERARHLRRLVEGDPPYPLEIAAAMQGISIQTAHKLLDALKLPDDILALMDPKAQRERGQEVLGKMPTYHLARLANNPRLHDEARRLAGQYVRREIKAPQLNAEVDRILSRSGGSRNLLGERQQPSRRLVLARGQISNAIDYLSNAKGRLQDLKSEGVLPDSAQQIRADIRQIAEIGEEILKIIG